VTVVVLVANHVDSGFSSSGLVHNNLLFSLPLAHRFLAMAMACVARSVVRSRQLLLLSAARSGRSACRETGEERGAHGIRRQAAHAALSIEGGPVCMAWAHDLQETGDTCKPSGMWHIWIFLLVYVWL
jgi:hypothetical protein